MRILIFLLPLLAPACAAVHSSRKDTPESRITISRLELGQKKGALLRCFLEKGSKDPSCGAIQSEILSLDNEWAMTSANELELLARKSPTGHAPQIFPGEAELPNKVVLDMIQHAQELSESEINEIRKAFQETASAFAQFRRERIAAENSLAQAAAMGNESLLKSARTNFFRANGQERDSELRGISRIAELLRKTRIDLDYAYRAILREHRRNIPGFRR